MDVKPVEVNPALLRALGLTGPQADPTEELLGTTDLDLAGQEARMVQYLIPDRRVVVLRIEKIENPFLKRAYELRRLEMRADGESAVREELLFHGTSLRNAARICRVNFDWRLCGANGGKHRGISRFGMGVNFSPEFHYASWYSDFTDGEQVVILAKVLIGKTCTGKAAAVVPPGGYDTTQNHDGNVLVKYDDSEFYPVYKIYYRRADRPPNRYHHPSSYSSNCRRPRRRSSPDFGPQPEETSGCGRLVPQFDDRGSQSELNDDQFYNNQQIGHPCDRRPKGFRARADPYDIDGRSANRRWRQGDFDGRSVFYRAQSRLDNSDGCGFEDDRHCASGDSGYFDFSEPEMFGRRSRGSFDEDRFCENEYRDCSGDFGYRREDEFGTEDFDDHQEIRFSPPPRRGSFDCNDNFPNDNCHFDNNTDLYPAVRRVYYRTQR